MIRKRGTDLNCSKDCMSGQIIDCRSEKIRNYYILANELGHIYKCVSK
jgi:hypothetical protein